MKRLSAAARPTTGHVATNVWRLWVNTYGQNGARRLAASSGLEPPKPEPETRARLPLFLAATTERVARIRRNGVQLELFP